MTTDEVVAPVIRSVHVRRTPDDSFRIFTERLGSWWPLATHSVYEERAVDAAFVDGKIVETSDTGERCEWGTVTAWEPPHRLAFTWHPGYPAAQATSVEIEFRADEDGTRVELTHRGWEALGGRAARTRASYVNGWVPVLEAFAGRAHTRGDGTGS
jgi:uncharacterized protein YndB with AHSA1/START domain